MSLGWNLYTHEKELEATVNFKHEKYSPVTISKQRKHKIYTNA